jgi:hypothetical protein
MALSPCLPKHTLQTLLVQYIWCDFFTAGKLVCCAFVLSPYFRVCIISSAYSTIVTQILCVQFPSILLLRFCIVLVSCPIKKYHWGIPLYTGTQQSVAQSSIHHTVLRWNSWSKCALENVHYFGKMVCTSEYPYGRRERWLVMNTKKSAYRW